MNRKALERNVVSAAIRNVIKNRMMPGPVVKDFLAIADEIDRIEKEEWEAVNQRGPREIG